MAQARLRSLLNHPLGGQVTLRYRLGQLRDRSLGLWLSQSCALCQRQANGALCLDCQRQFDACRVAAHRNVDAHRNQPIAPGHLRPSAPWPIHAWGDYDGTLKRSIAALKYNNNLALADLLGQALAADWNRHPLTPQPQVVPIPLHCDKLTLRGFNQVTLIGQSFCRATGLQLLDRGLIRQRATQPQFELSPQARDQNLADAFCLGPDLQRRRRSPEASPQPLIILDDIYTSGATARAAATVLEANGHRVLGIWVVARAGRTAARS